MMMHRVFLLFVLLGLCFGGPVQYAFDEPVITYVHPITLTSATEKMRAVFGVR